MFEPLNKAKTHRQKNHHSVGFPITWRRKLIKMIGQENVTLRMIILTSFSTIEFDSHGDVVNPGTRVHTDEPGSEGRVKTVFFDRVMIAVPSENLNKEK